MRAKMYCRLLLATLLVLVILVQPATLLARQSAALPLQKQHEEPIPTPTPLTGPDSPAGAPSQRDLTATLLAGETTINYDELGSRKVKFKVGDGWDLDQYLFAASSPLDFYIDLQGFKPHPSEPTKVTLRVYDVDQAGAPGYPQCQVEVDKVYVNGTYLGNLTGANNQWSIVTFSIPPGALNEGSNHFWVDIDVLTQSCWAVEVDWAEVEIPFNIAQVEASAFDDVTIKRGTTDDTITDPIWKTDFDASGNIKPDANPNDPIADKIKGSWFFNWGAREFKYRYKIDNWPSGARPTWDPTVRYLWEVQGTGQKSEGEITGWEKDFKITLPDTVGRYTLRVMLKIYHGDKLLRTENRTHTLYVLLNSPRGGTIAGASTGQPRTAWLDVATDWASDQSTDVGILDALNSSEYGGGSNPLGWGYGYPKNGPVTLIEDGAGKNGDCYTFRDVWRILAAILGISTDQTEYRPPNGFMTSTRVALDGNSSANARNKVTGSHDRWQFSNHQYGLYSGIFYDPTYGVKGPNTTAGKESSVFCKIDGLEGGRFRCTVLTPPPTKVLIAPTGSTVNGWSISEYEPVSTASSVLEVATHLAALVGTGNFTGNFSDTGYDSDGNGLFEHLQVDVELDVIEAGSLGILAALTTTGGDLIALGSLDPNLSHDTLLTHASMETGMQTISIYFNGHDIRAFEVDGPYTVSLGLFDEDGTSLDSADFTTGAYNHLDFQGLLIEVEALSDSGVDTDALSGYNLLRVAAQISMLAAGDVTVQGQLFAGNTFLANVTEMVSLGAGTHTLDLDFPGEAIAASGLDGPYTVYLSFSDPYYTGNEEYTTAAYGYTEFQPPRAFFTGSVSDGGNDTNGNGLYDELNVAAGVVALVPGTYTVHGILEDSAGNLIEAVEETMALNDTPTEVTLSFDGLLIHRHGVDGPYQVVLALTDTSGNDLMGVEYTTSAYAFTDFERPSASLDGIFADSGVDTDGDGFYNLLRIAVGVEVVEAGIYGIDGSLHDDNGSFIAGAQVERYLTAGTHIISLDFDGTTINDHGQDGPYHLLALELRQIGVGTMDSILEAHDTGAYAYTDFQPSGLLLTGNFADHGEDTNANGLYDVLVVEMELAIAQSGTYNFNARLVDANGEEIVWAAHTQYLTSGTHWVSLRFDGRYIYGNGVDGPYDVKDLSIYSGSQSFTLLDVYTTGAYEWQAFDPSGVASGTVTVDGQPVPNANIFISGIDSDLTDSSGAYRLTVLNSGTYVVNIDADPSLSPWQIWVNGIQVAEGTSATIPVVVGEVTEVSFVSSLVVHVPPIADANGPYAGNEGEPVTVDASGSSDPDGTIVLYEWDLDNDGEFDDATGVTAEVVFYENGTYQIGLRVTDDYGDSDTDAAEAIVDNVAPTVGPITAPVDPNEVNTLIQATADFTDSGVLDTHTALWDWGDGDTSAGTVTEENGSGTVSGEHTYDEAGVYTIKLTVTDDDGGSGESTFSYIVIYDPDGGFVTGGGWIKSPEGAYTPDPELAGFATFGFVSKYLRGADVPSGETEFHFETASGFKFHSTEYEWLVVSNDRAMYKGTGTVDGVPGYSFKLWATDGDLIGAGGMDRFRIKIWAGEDETQYVYDNQLGDPDYVAPTTALESGSIIIHSTNWKKH